MVCVRSDILFTISSSDLLNNRKNLSKFFNKKYSKGERLHLVSEIYDVTCFFLIKCHYFPHRSTKLFQISTLFPFYLRSKTRQRWEKKNFFRNNVSSLFGKACTTNERMKH